METGERVIGRGGRVPTEEVCSETETAEEELHVLAHAELTEVRAKGDKGEALIEDRALSLRERKVGGDGEDPAGLRALVRGGWEAGGVSGRGVGVRGS